MIEALGPPPGRAPVLPHVMWPQTCLLVWEGSGAATCPVALGPQAYLCILKTPNSRPIMASPGTGVGNALNAFVTSHTQHMVGIKYVQDIDTVGR
jgi:hypothetical protein